MCVIYSSAMNNIPIANVSADRRSLAFYEAKKGTVTRFNVLVAAFCDVTPYQVLSTH